MNGNDYNGNISKLQLQQKSIQKSKNSTGPNNSPMNNKLIINN